MSAGCRLMPRCRQRRSRHRASTATQPGRQPCPNCGADNSVDALFCENCGYDFTTGTMPRPLVEAASQATPSPTHSPPAQTPVSPPAGQ